MHNLVRGCTCLIAVCPSGDDRGDRETAVPGSPVASGGSLTTCSLTVMASVGSEATRGQQRPGCGEVLVWLPCLHEVPGTAF